MNRIRMALACATMVAVVAFPVAATPAAAATEAGAHVIGLTLGFEPTFTTAITYAYTMEVADRLSAASLRITAPLALLGDLDHLNLQAAFGTFALPDTGDTTAPWNAYLDAGFFLDAGTSSVSSDTGVGLSLGAEPGYYRDSWFAAGSFRYQKTVMTHRSHSDWYRELYPNVQDGWYWNDTGSVVLGVTGGGAPVENMRISGLVGYRMSDDFESYDPFVIPATADFSMRYQF